MTQSLREAVAGHPGWYHTIELGHGVVTPGHVDLRDVAPKVLPPTLTGRALDVGTYDGFWAFELERRGAVVTALDLPALDDAEWPPANRERLRAASGALGLELGRGFGIAHRALGSRVRRVELPVYDLAPEAVGGTFDLVFVGAILLHLRDPVRALEAVRSVLAPGGAVVLLEPVDPRLSLLLPRRPAARFQATETDFNWWAANVAALEAWLRAAGFGRTARGGLHRAAGLTLCALAARD